MAFIEPENDLEHRWQSVAQMSAFGVYRSLRTGPRGLTETEAARRIAADPEPVPPARSPRSVLLPYLLEGFGSPFVALLLGLIVVFVLIDDVGGAATLAVMVTLAVGLRIWQRGRSQRAVAGLRGRSFLTTTVRRRAAADSAPSDREVPADDVVPGDVVVLNPGDHVPGDVRLTAARGLSVDQAALSGESGPVRKDAGGNADPGWPAAGLRQLCLAGSTVADGTGTGVVVAAGPRTYAQTLAALAARLERRSSFDRGVQAVGRTLIRFMLVLVPLVFVMRGLVDGAWAQAALLAVAVAVGLTPEMLPVVVTSNLARGAYALARRKVIVNRLNAIQDLGAMTVVCVDKTGTLTEDRIVYAQSLDGDGRPDGAAAAYAALAEMHRAAPDLRYGEEILRLGRVGGEPGAGEVIFPEIYTKVDEFAFDYTRRMSTVIVRARRGESLMVCRGDADQVLARCTPGPDPAAAEAVVAQCIRNGMQVQAVAIRRGGPLGRRFDVADESDLCLVGFLCFLDPVRARAREAIAALRDYGVATKIVTGDAVEVACRVAGLTLPGPVSPVRGCDIDLMSDADLRAIVLAANVFAELTPGHKARVVLALQHHDEVVGVVGDGVNDTAALRVADVGIVADSGTAELTAAGDLVLLDRDLTVIVDGVVEGRRTLANTFKYLRMTASSNLGNALSVVAASVLLPIVPILPIQLLAQNLLYDLAQLALPWDRVEDRYLRRPRRWRADGLVGFMMAFGLLSSVFDLSTFAALWFLFGGREDHDLFRTGWFVEGLLSQLLIVLVLRSSGAYPGARRAAPVVVAAAALAAVTGCLLPVSPLAPALSMTPLPMGYACWVAGTLLLYALCAQVLRRARGVTSPGWLRRLPPWPVRWTVRR